MKAKISIHSVEELEKAAAGVIQFHEDAPDEANPEDPDDPYLGEEGILVVETGELEVEADFSWDDFPRELSFPLNFIGWDEKDERTAAAHGRKTHLPAQVTITLIRKWQDDSSGRNMALYSVVAAPGS